MEILVSRQLKTAHKQARHLSLEKVKLEDLIRKSENIEYYNNLEQKLVDYEEAINMIRKNNEDNINMVEKLIENKTKSNSRYRNNLLNKSDGNTSVVDSLLNSKIYTLHTPVRIRNHKYGAFNKSLKNKDLDYDFTSPSISLNDLKENPLAKEFLLVKNKAERIQAWLNSCEKQREEIQEKTRIFEKKIEAQIQTAVSFEYTEDDIFKCLKIKNSDKKIKISRSHKRMMIASDDAFNDQGSRQQLRKHVHFNDSRSMTSQEIIKYNKLKSTLKHAAESSKIRYNSTL